jgi:hypothetical protein
MLPKRKEAAAKTGNAWTLAFFFQQSEAKLLALSYIEIKKMTPRNSYFVLVFAILFALFLRLLYIQRPMRLDEANTVVRFASQDMIVAMSDYRLPNNHLLNTFFINLVYHSWGMHPILVRLPALAAGILLLPVLYVLTKRWYGQRAAYWALGWGLIAGTLIDFSVNGRAYTMVALLMLLLFYIAQRLLDGGRFWLYPLYGILAALGFFAVPTFIYPMGCVALWWGINLLWRRDWRGLGLFVLVHLFGAGLTVFLYSSVIIHSGLERLLGNSFVRGTDQVPISLFDLPFAIWSSLRFGIPTPIAILMILAAGASVFLWKKSFPPSLASALWVALLLLVYPVYPPQRVWSFLVPILAISGAAAFDYVFNRLKISQRWANLAFGLMLTISAIWMLYSDVITLSNETGRADGAEEAALYLDEILEGDELVLSNIFLGATIEYYWLYHEMELRPVQRGIRPRESFWEDAAGKRVVAVVMPVNNLEEFFNQVYLIPEGEIELILLEDLGEVQIYEVRQ